MAEEISQAQPAVAVRAARWRHYGLLLAGVVAFALVYRALKPAAD